MSSTDEMKQMTNTYIVGQTITGFRIIELSSELLREINHGRNLLMVFSSGMSGDFFGEVHGSDLDYLSHQGRILQDGEEVARVYAKNGLDAFQGEFPTLDANEQDATNDIENLSPLRGKRVVDVKHHTWKTLIELEDSCYLLYCHSYPATVVTAYVTDADNLQCISRHSVKYTP